MVGNNELDSLKIYGMIRSQLNPREIYEMGNQQVSTTVNGEVFRPHPELDTILVGNQGTIWSNVRNKPKHVQTDAYGYIVTQIVCKDGKRRYKKVHRLVAEVFLDPPEQDLVDKCKKEHHGKVVVNHKNLDRSDNRACNLEWVDTDSNNKHFQSNLEVNYCWGENQKSAKLTNKQVHEICKFYENGGTAKDAESVFGIAKSTATCIRSGHAWRRIWEKYNIPVKKYRPRKSGKTSTAIESTSSGGSE